MEVKGLAVAVPEGVVVELKQPQGGFVFQRHGRRTLLEEVEPLKVRRTFITVRRSGPMNVTPPPLRIPRSLIGRGTV